MKQLPVIADQSDVFDQWLPPVQEAIINTNGVFAISHMYGKLTWDRACKISKKILKTYMKATQHNPYELHPGLDFHKGQRRSTSLLHEYSTEVCLEGHVDKGLFKILVGEPSELQGLQLQSHGEEYHDVVQKLDEATSGTALAIVIPGFTLQLFDAHLSAARYRIQDPCGITFTQVFRCRLDSEYKLKGEEIEKILSRTYTSAVRGAWNLKVRGLDGKETYLEATSSMSIQELKEMYGLSEGILPEEVGFIYTGKVMDGGSICDYITSAGDQVITCVQKPVRKAVRRKMNKI